jgi:hypothetical protein
VIFGFSSLIFIKNSSAFEQNLNLTYDNPSFTYQEYFGANTNLHFRFTSTIPVWVKITDSEHYSNTAFSYITRENVMGIDYTLKTPYADTFIMIISGEIKSHHNTITDPPIKVRIICKNQSLSVKQDISVYLTASNRSVSSNSYPLYTNDVFYFFYSSDQNNGIEEVNIRKVYSFSIANTETNITSGSYTVNAPSFDSYYCEIFGNVHSHSSTSYDPNIPISVKVNTEIDYTPWISLLIIALVGIGVICVVMYKNKMKNPQSKQNYITHTESKKENGKLAVNSEKKLPIEDTIEQEQDLSKKPTSKPKKTISIYYEIDICEKCGTEIEVNRAFCQKCGTKSRKFRKK